MDVEAALVTHLEAQPALTALVGTRIYPLLLKQDATLPALVYQRISTVRERGLSRAALGTEVRIQWKVFATTYAALAAVAAQLRAALLSFASGNGVTVHDVTLEGDFDDYEADTRLASRLIDALILVDGDG